MHHLVGDALAVRVAPVAVGFRADQQGRQDLQARLGVPHLPQRVAERLQRARHLLAGPALHGRDDRPESLGHQVADPLHRSLEGPLAPDRVVRLRRVAVHADPQLERMRTAFPNLPQHCDAPRRKEGRIGEDRRRAVPQRILEDALHFVVHEGLAAGEVVLLHTHAGGLLQRRPHLLPRHEPEGVIVGGAGDEAVAAAQVAHRSAHLEPELIESRERDCGKLWSDHRGTPKRLRSLDESGCWRTTAAASEGSGLFRARCMMMLHILALAPALSPVPIPT